MGLEVLAAAAIISGAASTAYQAYAGEEGKKQQKQALNRQREAQGQAVAQATSARRSAEMENAKVNQKEPDVSALLTNASKPTTSSSLLTGASGIDFSKLKLGRPGGLLGQ